MELITTVKGFIVQGEDIIESSKELLVNFLQVIVALSSSLREKLTN
jgi:hypothetical protein